MLSIITKLIFRALSWPFRLIWRLTEQKVYPAGKPFNMREPLVIDGDTLYHDGIKIRVWGIDAPEMSEPTGPAAKAYMKKLVRYRNIYVVPRDVDKYGRIVAELFCGRGDLGRSMVEDGYALSWGNRYPREEKRARRKKLGLWKFGPITDPALARQRTSA
ncbi:MAG: thermonuclease family protein [Roseibium sp.]|uniref:thermonuclease family protein n=1 Tax=Roseibium sp. TaxID=1936156 RepID=UPI0032972968